MTADSLANIHQPKFQRLMEGCRKMTPSHLLPLFVNTLENLEVGLLEAADRAESNEMQSRCFAAMKAVKEGQQTLVRAFLKSVDRGFADFLAGKVARPQETPNLEDLSADQLSLVDKEEVEWALPAQNLVSRAQVKYREPLYGLEQRLAIVNGGEKLPPEAVPGGPEQLVNAFREALKATDAFLGLEAVKPIWFMLFAAFDRYLMRELDAYYDEYNRRLVNAGILPNLRYQVRKNKAATAGGAAAGAGDETAEGQAQSPQAQAAPQDTVADGAAAATFQAIKQALSHRRRAGGAPVSPAPEGAAGSVAEGRAALVDTLQGIQHDQGPLGDEYFEDLRVDTELIERLESMLKAERQRVYESVQRHRLTEDDIDVIELVGMLFDFMLRDEHLPNVAKALLSRLHTPYLKVAILDVAFFVQRRHPARRLLDAMVQAGGEYVVEDDLQQGIFPCMREVVERVLDEFSDDIELFDELLELFKARVEEVRHKAQAIERRTVEAAAGQDKLQAARRRSHVEIARLLTERQICEEAQAFFSQVWAEKLMFILLREPEGEQSEAWELAVHTARDIINSIEPREDKAERARLEESLLALRQNIHDALHELSAYGADDNERMLEQIFRWQDAALSGSVATAADTAVPQEDVAEPAVVVEPEPRVVLPLSPEEHRHAERLDETDFGTWFEFRDAGGGTRRLRLAWRSQQTEKFMFVDAIGVKAATHDRTELAKMMHRGEVKIIEAADRPFLDRALGAVLRFLGRDEE